MWLLRYQLYLLCFVHEINSFVFRSNVHFSSRNRHKHHQHQHQHQQQHQHDQDHPKKCCHDAVVIGGGVGGLVCASLLAASSSCMSVVLLEKNACLGGRMNSEWLQSKYRFDVGPSLLLLRDVYENTFNSLGYSLKNHVELLEVAPLYKCVFSDSKTLRIHKNSYKMKQELENEEKGAYKAYTEYLFHASVFLDFGYMYICMYESFLIITTILPSTFYHLYQLNVDFRMSLKRNYHFNSSYHLYFHV